MSYNFKTSWALPLLLFSLFGLKALQADAQIASPTFEAKNLIASSPEAAMLGRFGDIPIGYYTGTADVSIPIYTIKEAGVEIPIVLSYHGSGIKVGDQATNVGLGWSLEPGGSVIQVVNGLPDAMDNLPLKDGYADFKTVSPQGVFSSRMSVGTAYFNGCSVLSGDTVGDKYQTLDALNHGMGQPDIYQYSFSGYSGKFYINPETHNIVLINQKDQDITFTPNGNGWTAKTMDGTTFNFTTEENSGWNTGYYMGVTSKLTSVVFNNGKTINFDYQDGGYNWFTYSESFHSEFPLLLGAPYDNQIVPSLSFVDYHLKMLTRITSSKAIINFNLEDRADLPANPNAALNPKRIGSVDVTDSVSGKKIKTFTFNYDYFQGAASASYLTGNVSNPYTYADVDAKRLKLLSVQETGYTPAGAPVVKPPYTFTYNEKNQLPLKTSFSTDFWGYYNGQVNAHAIPDLSFFFMSDDPQYQNVAGYALTSFQGANRSPDTAKMKTWALTKVVYPTGGTTAFDYEPNTFGNYAYPDIGKIQSSQHNGYASDYNLSSDVKSFSFTLPKTEVLDFNVIITKGPNTSHSFYDLQPSTVVLTQTVGAVTTTLNTWQMTEDDHSDFDANGTKQWNTSYNLQYVAGATYTITTSLPDALGPQGTSTDDASVSVNFAYYSLPADYQTSYGAGLRVSAIRNYTQTGQIASNKVIKYLNEDNSSSGILMSPIKPLYGRDEIGLINANTPSAPDYILRILAVWFISSESLVPYSDGAQGSPVGYSRIEEDDMAPDGSLNGKHIYFYNNLASNCQINVPPDPNPINGLISKEQVFNNTSSVPLQETNYTYLYNNNASSFTGYKLETIYVGIHDCPYITSAHDRDLQHEFMIYGYPINSFKYKLTNKTVTQNFNGQSLTSTENYAYNVKGQLIQSDTYNSNVDNNNNTPDKKSIKYLYPLDNPSDPMSSALIANNHYDDVQQQTQLLNDNTVLSTKKLTYRIDHNLIAQNDVTSSFLASSNFAPDVTFDIYGPYKSLRQFTQKGLTTTLIWSFKYNYPIAEIKNASYATVESILGGAAAVDAFASQGSPDKATIDAFLAPLRASTSLGNAQITTFSIDPLLGMTSSTDPKGQTAYYEYDNFQRLMNVKDKDGNIVKHMDYHYQGQ